MKLPLKIFFLLLLVLGCGDLKKVEILPSPVEFVRIESIEHTKKFRQFFYQLTPEVRTPNGEYEFYMKWRLDRSNPLEVDGHSAVVAVEKRVGNEPGEISFGGDFDHGDYGQSQTFKLKPGALYEFQVRILSEDLYLFRESIADRVMHIYFNDAPLLQTLKVHLE